jgi:hypothetical protein
MDPGQEGQYVVEQLLIHKTLRGRTYYLVLWQGHTSVDFSWEPAEHLAHYCPERIAEYEAAAPRRLSALRVAPSLLRQVPPGPLLAAPPEPTAPRAPAGWVVAPAGPPALGAAIGGQTTAGSGARWPAFASGQLEEQPT